MKITKILFRNLNKYAATSNSTNASLLKENLVDSKVLAQTSNISPVPVIASSLLKDKSDLQINDQDSLKEKDNKDNNNTSLKEKSNLPNTWKLVTFFLKENPNIKYCRSHKTYYIYSNDIWSIVDKDTLIGLILNFLKSKYPKDYEKFNLRSLDDIFLLISQNEVFSMPQAIAKANSNGFLIPFLNGVLNTKNSEFSPHSPDNYTTHIIPVIYSKEDSIKNTKFAEFLTSIVNNNSMRLKILRACLYIIITNNLIYQIALYIYGPGGTGKSTFINILIYLLGKDVTLSSSISQVTSKFGIASLVGKILLILNDVSLYRGQEPKAIKNIVTQDPMEAEQKYKQPFTFTPSAFLILTSNTLWDIKNSTTGLSRRMVYFPFENVPNFKELDLFRILPSGVAIGTLMPHMCGFINWILNCPKENLEVLYRGGSDVTALISPDSIHVNPLHVFVKDVLIKDATQIIKLGSRQTNNNTLYGAYLLWANTNGIVPITFKSFSILILDLLKQLGWNVTRKRIAIGLVIQGIGLNDSWAKERITSLENREVIPRYKDREFFLKDPVTKDDFNN